MKLIPASSARWMMRMLSSWSVSPHAPNIMAPRHSGLTWTPVRPSSRCSIERTLLTHGRDVEAHVVQRRAHAGDDRGGERLAPFGGQAVEVRGEDRRADERVDVLGCRGLVLQPAADRAEPRAAQARLGL